MLVPLNIEILNLHYYNSKNVIQKKIQKKNLDLGNEVISLSCCKERAF